MSQKPHLLISRNCLYILSVAVARSSSDDRATHYVLPVLRMTSYFYKMEPMGQNQRDVMFRRFRQVAAQGAKLLSTTAG